MNVELLSHAVVEVRERYLRKVVVHTFDTRSLFNLIGQRPPSGHLPLDQGFAFFWCMLQPARVGIAASQKLTTRENITQVL